MWRLVRVNVHSVLEFFRVARLKASQEQSGCVWSVFFESMDSDLADCRRNIMVTLQGRSGLFKNKAIPVSGGSSSNTDQFELEP
jgi:hypothetical protein